jgi:acylphosphatase
MHGDRGDGPEPAAGSRGVPNGVEPSPDKGLPGDRVGPASPDRVTFRFRLAGRVQGVGFRYFVRHRALTLEIQGWVRNTPDGSVEAEATGPEQALAALEAELWKGPPGARVDRVERVKLPAPVENVGFEIVG